MSSVHNRSANGKSKADSPWVTTVPHGPDDDIKARKEDILSRIDVAAEYAQLGVRFTKENVNANGWRECRAMGREDKDPSAGVNVFNGRYKSFGGGEENLSLWDFALKYCPQFGRDILEVIAYFEGRTGGAPRGRPSPRRKQAHPTYEDAVAAEARQRGWGFVGGWGYRNPDGSECLRIARYEWSDRGRARKTYRPFHETPAGWVCTDPGGALPLYRLPELIAAGKDDPIWLCEGEKCAEIGATLGLTATTSAHGASSAGKTDWGPLAGRRVVIVPDNDRAGEVYANAVLGHLKGLSPRPIVKVLRLPGLPDGGDIEQWNESLPDRTEPDAAVAELERLAGRIKPVDFDGEGARSEGTGAVGSLATTRVSTIKPQPVRWLVPDYIPRGKLIVWAGDGGLGKSTITIDTAARITRGQPCFGLHYGPRTPADVLLISCEDDFADTVVPRLIAVGADMERIRKVDGITKEDGRAAPFSLAHYRELEADLEANPATKLVVIDPAGAYVGRTGIDDHRNAELTALLAPLAELAGRRDVTVMLVCHVNKGVNAKAVHRIMGGAGYVNSARAVFVLGPDPEDEDRRVFVRAKGNLGPKPAGRAFRMSPMLDAAKDEIRDSPILSHLGDEDREALLSQMTCVVWDHDDANLSADDVLGRENKGNKGPTKVERAGEWLAGFLKSGPKPSDEIFAEGTKAGFTKDNLYLAKQGLGIKAKPFGFQGGFRWGLGDPNGWPVEPRDWEGD